MSNSDGYTEYLISRTYPPLDKRKILIIGGGNQASYTIDIIEKEGKYSIFGIIDSLKEIGSDVFGYPVIGRQENICKIIEENDIHGGIIAIGDNWSRWNVWLAITKEFPKFNFVNAIHPSVIVGNGARIGKGVVAMAGCFFNTNSKIGDFTFFATGSQIEHDCNIHDFASVSAGTVLGGYVELGMFSALTLNVTVLDRLKIGQNTVVGAGAVVLKDLPNDVLAYGNPCKIIRERINGEKFLK